jgi:hypothetical protein
MLTMNLTKLTHAELAAAVSQRCSRFGDVEDVTILQPNEEPSFVFALVGMQAARDIDRIVDNLGAVKVGALALFRIEHETASKPRSTRSGDLQADWAALV